MNLDAKALVGFFKEIEASRERQKAETEHQREIFKKARAKFFDPKAMRIVLQRRAMDATKRDQQDYDVHAYELALAGKKAAMEALEAGATVREAAKAGGISTGAAGNLAKVVQKSSFMNSETGEITEPRSPAIAASDSASDPTEPEEGRAGERGLDELSSNAGAAVKMPPKGLSVLERLKFHSFVDPVSGCWLWTASLFARGAAQFHDEGTHTVQGHRAAWSAVHGPIPAGMFVCHKCDVRRCVNPDHLFLGTHQDNMDDMVAKGRQGPRGGIKITPEEAQAILDDPRPNGDIAIAFNISRSTVSDIKRGARWTNLNRNASRDIPAAVAATEADDGTEHQTAEAGRRDDSRIGRDHPTASGIGDADAARSPSTGEDATLPVSDRPAEMGVHAIRMHEGTGLRVEANAGDAPPTESLGAVAPSAGRVAPYVSPTQVYIDSFTSDDLAIPPFLRRSA